MNTQKYNFSQFLSRYNNEPNELEIFKVLNGLPDLSDGGIWLAGGAIRRTLIGDLLTSDFDFFFESEDKFKSYKNSLLGKGAKEINKNDHQESYEITINEKRRIIQLIKINYYKSAEEVIDSFDFTITQFAYDGINLICGEHSLWDLSRRKLALHRLTYGIATMRRMIKYTKQDFTACAGVMQQLLESVASDPRLINSQFKYID
jgi:hypothetical protein